MTIEKADAGKAAAELAAFLEDDAGMRRVTPAAEIRQHLSQRFTAGELGELYQTNPWLKSDIPGFIVNIRTSEFNSPDENRQSGETVTIGDCGFCGDMVIYQLNGWPQSCPSCHHGEE